VVGCLGVPTSSSRPRAATPNSYLRSAGLDTTIPWLRCLEGSAFTGDFRAAGITGATIDVNVFSTDFNIGPFPLSVILHSDNGTPANSDDDWAVFNTGASIPAPGTGWKRIAFSIPSSAVTLPAGWGFIQYGPGSPAVPDWNAVITGVSRLEFSFGDPELFYIFQMWTVGADNIGLTATMPCYPNCDGSTSTPILTANDFACFLNRYAENNSYANCDGVGGLTANDFACFLTRYAQGCT
jgi:hypothetical protein